MAYNPARNSWRLLPAMPLPRSEFAAIWTGRRVLVWGGNFLQREPSAPSAEGASYTPRTP